MVPVLILLLTMVALVAAVLAVASARWAVDPLAPPSTSTPDHGLAQNPDAADIPAVRFDTAPRGYAMADVDAHLDELRADLDVRERELARLRAEAGEA